MFLISDMFAGITDLLMGRSVPDAKIAEAVRKTVLEYTNDYKFSELQVTGPLVQLTPLVPNYDVGFFQPVISGQFVTPLPLKKINSFFIFLDPYVAPSTTNYMTLTNAGYNLVFKTIDRLEVLMQVPGIPTNWTRFNQQIWIAPLPVAAYYIFMRYQVEHEFPNAGTTNAGTDTIYMPNDWQEVVEYGAAQRLAQVYNLSTKATELNTRLLGDQRFQETSGVEGQPGLLFRRTSDESRDQTTTTKRFRLRMGQR